MLKIYLQVRKVSNNNKDKNKELRWLNKKYKRD